LQNFKANPLVGSVLSLPALSSFDLKERDILKPRIRIRLRSETELFNKSSSSRTIFEDVILLYFEFKNGSKFVVLKKNLVVVDF
jgi:hypothetical protein